MKRKMKTLLLSAFVAVTASTTAVATVLTATPAMAETQTTRFAMVEGAAIRYSEPLGLRFITELGTQEYAELTREESGVTKELGMFIMPYEYIDTNADEVIDVTDYASVETKLDYTFYSSDGSVNKVYEYEDKNGATYYRANGVISNLKLKNYAREFVGVGYIKETQNGVTKYEYTDINYADNVRSAAYVAIEAHADPDYAEIDNAKRTFEKYVDGAQLYDKWGVTATEDGKYVYAGATYNSLAEVKAQIANYDYSLTMGTVKYVKEDGEASLNVDIQNGTVSVGFNGAHAVYTSSDESIVKVDKDGTLTWVKNGTATITATFMGETKTCDVISGVIDFEDGVLPSYITEGGRATLSVVDGNGGKVLQAAPDSTYKDTRIKMAFSHLGAIFEDESIAYMAFDLKIPETATTTTEIYYQNGEQNGWTKYDAGTYYTSPKTAVTTYYFPRTIYEAWVSNEKTEGRFLNVGTGLSGDMTYFIDNIRGVTAEEKSRDWWSFEYGGIRKNDSVIYLYDPEEAGAWQLSFSYVDSDTVKYTNENVTDGKAALQFTKKSGTTLIGLNGNTSDNAEFETVREAVLRDAGYIAYDLYVPEGSDAKLIDNSRTIVTTLSEGWNTVYAPVSSDLTVDKISQIYDSTGSTYVIDNIRLLSEAEYIENVYGMEMGGSTLRFDVDSTGEKGTGYWYAVGDDTWNVAYSMAFTSNVKNVHYDTEVVHDGEYSLSFEKVGDVNLQFRADTETYARLKNGFSFWLYSTVAINGTGTGNFNNGNGQKPNGGAGYFVKANEWTRITLTADDIVQGTGMNGCKFLSIVGSTNGTYYLDGFKPLTNYTISLDAGAGSVASSSQTITYGASYTLETPTPAEGYKFLGWYNGDELVPTTGTWTIDGNVTLTAEYEKLPEYYYNTTVEKETDEGVRKGVLLQASTHTNENQGSLPQNTADTEDMSYLKFNGSYGLNDFLVFDFTGDNMPIMTFFNTEVKNTIYNQEENADVRGWIVTNGMTTPDRGLPYGGCAGAHANRISIIGSYKISYKYDDSGTGTILTQARASEGSANAPSPIGMAKLQSVSSPYRAIIGWTENDVYMNLCIRVLDLTTGQTVVDYNLNKYLQKADWEGDIALYGHFGRDTYIDAVYPIEEDTTMEAVEAKYLPAVTTYKGEWNDNALTLEASTYEGNASIPNVGSTDMSYVAFNGSYGYNDYVVFDFTGSNMPIISFANSEVTNTVFNNETTQKTSDADETLWAGIADESVTGWVWFNGLYLNDGTAYGGEETDKPHWSRLALIGKQKVLCFDDNSNSKGGGFRANLGSAVDPNPLSIRMLKDVTDTYRMIIGFDRNTNALQMCAINMMTGSIVYQYNWSFGNHTLTEGSIALHGQFGKTTVLDSVFGIEENTTLDELLAKYAKDTDYSDEAAVELDRYAYASLSDGQWTLDGTNQVTNPTDYRLDANAYATYKNAGFNIVLAQDMISPDNGTSDWTENGLKYMDMAYEAGLKVILTDWHLQILSAPIKVSDSGAQTADSTYVPWIFETDSEATTGAAADYLGYLTALGITADTTRFADSDALDKFIYDQMKLYMGHPAFYGVMLADEPSYHNAYCYGEVYKSIKRVMPKCYVQYNLLPLEHSFGTIQYRYPGVADIGRDNITNEDIETAYKSYVEAFLDTMGTDYIQYDDYPFKSSTETIWGIFENTEPYIDPTSLRNIQLVAEIAKERGLDVKVVSQSSVMKTGGASGALHIRQVTEDDARWLNNYLMGFGVKQINYFTYWTKRASSSSGEYFVDGGSFVNRDGTKTALYDIMQTIMADNTKFAPTISHFDYNASKVVTGSSNKFSNEHIVWGTLTSDSFKWVTDVTTSTDATLVTELYDKENYNYMYMVMNTIDPNEKNGNSKDTTQSITVTFDSSVTEFYVYDQRGNRTLQTGNTYTVTLTAGQAVYLMPKF